MKVFKTELKLREIGGGYGLPMFHIEFGFGTNYDPIKLIERLAGEGMNTGSWVTLGSGCLGEQGVVTFIEGLTQCRVKVEVEDDGTHDCPPWFMRAERWIVEWREAPVYNYGALRPMRDFLTYSGPDFPKFIQATEKLQPLRALLVPDPSVVFPLVKNTNIRVYKKEKE